MEAFALEVLSRLPLAEAVMRCWQWALDPQALQQIFERFRGRSYEGVLTFETIVNLTASALVEHRGSGNQAFTRAAEAEVNSRKWCTGSCTKFPSCSVTDSCGSRHDESRSLAESTTELSSAR
jgi:hypothetical protein